MSSSELIKKVELLQEWESILAETKEEVERLRDGIKREMDARGVEELEAGVHIIRYTTVLSMRLDTTSLKKQLPDLYQQYQRKVTSRRFTIG